MGMKVHSVTACFITLSLLQLSAQDGPSRPQKITLTDETQNSDNEKAQNTVGAHESDHIDALPPKPQSSPHYGNRADQGRVFEPDNVEAAATPLSAASAAKEKIQSTDSRQKAAFVFGGNGQIGSEVVKMLLEQGYDITILNRGKDYYNSKEDIEPKVTHIQCDRFKGLAKHCPAFSDYLGLLDAEHVDVVVDTNAYTTKYMRESTTLFKAINVGVYIFISPDSVYEVCIKRHYGPTKETDAERPSDKKEYEEYKNSDKYGHYKLAAEEELKQSGLNYLVFRAPDVIGPRDTTSRFWIYHMWVKYFDILRTPIPLPLQLKTLTSSYVYLPDIVQGIRLAVTRNIRNETFNVAFREPVTLSTLLLEVAAVLDVEITFDHEVEPDKSYHLYPSTGRGQLDIGKASRGLGFVPTPFKDAIKETVLFYQSAQKIYPTERTKVVEALVNNIAKETVKSSFKKAVLGGAYSGLLKTKHDHMEL